MFKPKHLFTTLAVSTALFGAALSAQAQLIYSEDFSSANDSTNWVVNYGDTGSNYVNFSFDYTTIGIPPAPHSTGGNTKGLKMSPDITAGSLLGAAAVSGVSVSPTNFSISDNFDMHADMWINYNGAIPPPATLTTGNGGSGSTIVYGCGYGTVGATPQVAGSIDSILCGVQTDNGSSAEVRMYGSAQAGSYQNGVYQSTGTIIPGFPGEPFVYNSPGGTRAFYTQSTWTAVPSPNWTNAFPSVKPPQAQINLFSQQTNIQCNLGAADFGWHDVEVEKVGNVIVYLIDGQLAATGDYSSAGTPAGDKLVFTAFDINSSPSTDPNFANLNFVVFANIVVSNLPTVVSISAPVSTCTEGSPGSPGEFTLTRSSSGTPLTVNYNIAGTATNGVQYQALSGSVTFAADALSTNIYIVPIDDGVPRLTTSVVLTLLSGPGYGGAGDAVVNILDNDPTTVDISSGSQAYGRYTNTASGMGNNDFVPFTVTRRGKLTTGSDLTVNLSYSGAAVGGSDYTPVSTVTIPDGTVTNVFYVSPVDNPAVTTNRTVTVAVGSGTGYAVGVGPASGTIVSAHYDAAPVLFTDPLTDATDATNWNIVYGCGDPFDNSTDFSADFGISLASAAGGITIPPPPGGNATALHLTCNKSGTPSSAGAVNAYFTNLFLSGNYAVRFNMNIIQGQINQTEGVVFGINHSGSLSNWWYGSGFLTNYTWSSDGIWYWVTAQTAGAGAGDYLEFTGNGGTNNNTGWKQLATKSAPSFAQVFKENPGPFTGFDASGNQSPGVPDNTTPALGYDASTWSDVEIRQSNNIVTMSINHTPVFVQTNTTVWKSGYLMLGYSDPFSSVGSPDAGVYFANLQVVQLGPSIVTINSISIAGSNVVIKFTTTSTLDTVSSFTLTSAGSVGGAYNPVGSASIISLGSNQFQATAPYVSDGGAQQFYRIMH
jgi:hypothetical protein